MTEAIPESYRPDGDGFDVRPFHSLIERLRHPELGCPWDSSRTLESMGKPLAGEAAEAAEALAGNDAAHQCEELGDVFLNVMLATVIAEEQGLFTWRDVVDGVTAKLIRRHPHVFGDTPANSPEEAMSMFLEAKAREKGRSSGGDAANGGAGAGGAEK
ncbi:MAG: nucleotide pyrophosphohydrolase [Planctomycetes bacterium]|nr:nucleotide pyrophosphohydrolase [Planctomycetota bacterium]MCC8116375.1 nucleotide pyrophosphohydrolase [Planctomycetota bacterium]MCD7895992.1 hypothetical protein [Planctomycetaceae bacterium]